MDSMDEKQKHQSLTMKNSGDYSGFGSPVSQRHSTHGECPRVEFDHLEARGDKMVLADATYLESLEDYSDTSMEDVYQIKMKSNHGMVKSGIISRSAGHPRTSSDGSVSSYVEISAIFETENTSGDEEEVIIAEVVPIVRCAPKPIPEFKIIKAPASEDVMLKSGDMFLRAIVDTDKPKIIIDKIWKPFKHQYRFKSETKVVLDTDGKSHCLKCFWHDFGNKSFYLVPHKTAGANRTTTGSESLTTTTTGSEQLTTTGTGNNTTTTTGCPETIVFTCVEADRYDVVVEMHRNSKFWYIFKLTPSPGVLESLAYPNYFLSFEKNSKAVLRKTKDPDSESDSLRIDIIKCDHKCIQHLKRLLHTFSCS